MNVVIAFPKIENAKSIRSILMKSGYQVDAVCTTGGQALQNVNALRPAGQDDFHLRISFCRYDVQ